jgi:uncharacterized membrane protein HdeD (DUF308 family)
VTRFDANQPGDRPAAQMSKEAAVSLAAGVLVLIGGAMQFATVSVASGAGVLIIGTVLAFGGFLIAALGDGKKWVIIVALLIAALCVVNVISAEHSLDQRRQEISNIFSN